MGRRRSPSAIPARFRSVVAGVVRRRRPPTADAAVGADASTRAIAGRASNHNAEVPDDVDAAGPAVDPDAGTDGTGRIDTATDAGGQRVDQHVDRHVDRGAPGEADSDQPADAPEPAAVVVDLGRWDPDHPRLPNESPPAPSSPFPRSAGGEDRPEPVLARATNPTPTVPPAAPAASALVLPPPRLPDAAPPASPANGDGSGTAPAAAPANDDSSWPGAPLGWEPEDVDPRGLVATDWMRPLVLFAQVLLFPSVIAGWPILPVAVVAMVGVQAIWWAAATENARRARPSSPHRVPPGPLQAASWWLVPLAYTGGAAALLVGLAEWSDGSTTASVDRDVILLVARVAIVAGGVVAWYWPYGRMVRVARWIGASQAVVRRWFWLPFVVAALMVVQIVLLSLSVLGGFGQDSGSRTVVIVSMWVAIIAPIGATLVTGRRALLEVDGAAKETYQKRAMPPLDPAEFIARRERLFGGPVPAAVADSAPA